MSVPERRFSRRTRQHSRARPGHVDHPSRSPVRTGPPRRRLLVHFTLSFTSRFHHHRHVHVTLLVQHTPSSAHRSRPAHFVVRAAALVSVREVNCGVSSIDSRLANSVRCRGQTEVEARRYAVETPREPIRWVVAVRRQSSSVLMSAERPCAISMSFALLSVHAVRSVTASMTSRALGAPFPDFLTPPKGSWTSAPIEGRLA